jgi:thiamine pyrophosphokinase
MVLTIPVDRDGFSGYIPVMNHLIIASGELGEPEIYRDVAAAAGKVVCADGGVRHARALGLVPHVVVGDLDSLGEEDTLFLKDSGVEILRHPTDKDATDTELALEWSLENGACSVTLIGATGTRLDHTLANVLLLKRLADRGIPGCIVDRHNEIHLVTGSLTLTGKPGDLLSVLPVGGTAEGVTLTGLFFPLTRARIPLGSTLGVSNRFVGGTATVSVARGVLVVTRSRD